MRRLIDRIIMWFAPVPFFVVLIMAANLAWGQQPEAKTRFIHNYGNQVWLGSYQLDGTWQCPETKQTCTATAGGLLISQVGPEDTVFSGRMLADVWRSYELTVVSDTEMTRTKTGIDPDDGTTLYTDPLDPISGSELWQTGLGVSSDLKQLYDGLGNALPMHLSDSAVWIDGSIGIDEAPFQLVDMMLGPALFPPTTIVDFQIAMYHNRDADGPRYALFGLQLSVNDSTGQVTDNLEGGTLSATHNAGNIDLVRGINTIAASNSPGVVNRLIGTNSNAIVYGPGTYSALIGEKIEIDVFSGTVDTAHGIQLTGWTGAGTIAESCAIGWDPSVKIGTVAYGLCGQGPTNMLIAGSGTDIPLWLVGNASQSVPLFEINGPSGDLIVDSDTKLSVPDLQVTTQYTPGVAEACTETGKIVTNNTDMCWCNGTNWLCVTGVIQ